MQLYGIPNCSTVKKSRDWLDQHAVAYTFHDLKKHGIDAATLQSRLQQIPWQDLLNRKGLTWRGLSDELKNSVQHADLPSNSNAIALMRAKTSLIKRPVLVDNSQVILLGFNESAYRKQFLKDKPS